jgi:hypothetical protein
MDEYIETVGEVGEDFGLKVIETKYHMEVMRFRCLVHQKVGTGTDRNRIHVSNVSPYHVHKGPWSC